MDKAGLDVEKWTALT